jgi:hypothetical protein
MDKILLTGPMLSRNMQQLGFTEGKMFCIVAEYSTSPRRRRLTKILNENLRTTWIDSLSFSVRTLELSEIRSINAKVSKIKGVTAKPKHDFIKGLL